MPEKEKKEKFPTFLILDVPSISEGKFGWQPYLVENVIEKGQASEIVELSDRANCFHRLSSVTKRVRSICHGEVYKWIQKVYQISVVTRNGSPSVGRYEARAGRNTASDQAT
jgi:hypothetical protein